MAFFEEARHKLNRGKEHFELFDAAFKAFVDSNPYSVEHEYDAEQNENRLRFKIVRPLPQHRFGLLLGDIVHNLRSALDYIAWRLAGSDIADRLTMFPICKTEPELNSTRWRYSKIHPDAMAYIRSLQPYTRPDPKRSVLWILHELDTRDKHKLITMTQAITVGAKFILNDPHVTIPYAAIENPIEHDTILAIYFGPPREVKMEFEFAFGVSFEKSILGTTSDQVGRCLAKIFDAVDVIIDNFERAAAANPDWIAHR